MNDNKENEKVVLRVSAPVKRDLEKIAKREKRSMNQQASVFLESAVREHSTAV